MKVSMFSVVPLLAICFAAPASSASTKNVFMSGKIFEGEQVVTTFAAHVVAGETLPVNDRIRDDAGVESTVRLALTPYLTEGAVTIVSVYAEWATGSLSPGEYRHTFRIAKGESKVIPFGNCGRVYGKLVGCSHTLLLNATVQD